MMLLTYYYPYPAIFAAIFQKSPPPCYSLVNITSRHIFSVTTLVRNLGIFYTTLYYKQYEQLTRYIFLCCRLQLYVINLFCRMIVRIFTRFSQIASIGKFLNFLCTFVKLHQSIKV